MQVLESWSECGDAMNRIVDCGESKMCNDKKEKKKKKSTNGEGKARARVWWGRKSVESAQPVIAAKSSRITNGQEKKNRKKTAIK